MPPVAPHVTDTELAILDVLWTRGPATIREITEQLYRQATTSQYATVQKLLERLEQKKCVRRDRAAFAHRFEPVVQRSSLIGSRLQEVAEKLCEGSLAPLLLHLVESTRLSTDDRERLQKLIDRS